MTNRTQCDAPHCPARAVLHVLLEAGTLHFCAHHYTRHAPALRPLALIIIEDAEPQPESTPRPKRRHPYREMLRRMRHWRDAE